jgi:(p)ppGpp synthase/HD superfamily hydrolase
MTDEAYSFAIDAHNSIGQVRKYSGEPYHVHPLRVARAVIAAGGNFRTIQAAFLHDVLEDVTPKNPSFDLAAIAEKFGPITANIVLQLTDVFTREAFPKFNREKRKELEAVRLSMVGMHAQTVKVADLIDNTADILAHDEGFARVYIKEKKVILNLISEGPHAQYPPLKTLLEIARKQIDGHKI